MDKSREWISAKPRQWISRGWDDGSRWSQKVFGLKIRHSELRWLIIPLKQAFEGTLYFQKHSIWALHCSTRHNRPSVCICFKKTWHLNPQQPSNVVSRLRLLKFDDKPAAQQQWRSNKTRVFGSPSALLSHMVSSCFIWCRALEPFLVGGIPTPVKNMKVSWD